MAKGFILKGAKGESAGFLQQAGSVLRCMARADGGEARLVLRYADGGGGEQTLALDGREQEWPCAANRAIDCAYVAREGRLLLATDERARRAFEADRVRMRQKDGPAVTRKSQPRQDPPDETRPVREQPHRERGDAQPDAARQAAAQQTAALRAMPERRWPPPPCWPSARYVSGRWTQG